MIESLWSIFRLQEVVWFQEGPGILAKDFSSQGVPLVRLAGLGGYEVTLAGCNYIDSILVDKKWNHFKLKNGDILVSTSASLGRPAVVGAKAEGAIFYTGIIRFRPATTELDAGYLRTFLGSRIFMDQAEAFATGSVIRHFGPSHLREMFIPLPPPSIQRAIATTLGALDDKIDLNRRMNETLEAMARALFKDWFVDFGPTRAKIEGRAPYLAPEIWSLFPDRLDDDGKPEGWSEVSIYEVSNVIYGAPFASSGFNASGQGKPLIRIRDLPNENPGVWTLESHPKGYTVKAGDIVVGMDGEFRSYIWGGVDAWLNQRVCVFAPKTGISAAFVRNSIIAPLADIESTEVATTVIHLGKNDIDRFTVKVPDNAVLDEFNRIAQPLYEKIVANKQENSALAATRDLLLPKLMSGEIRVKDAEKIAETAL